jgi:hypothetical protein
MGVTGRGGIRRGQGAVNPIARPFHGVAAALRARPKVFLAVATGVFILDVTLPPLLLSIVRKPWDYFAFNPWLAKLPAYLAASEVPLRRKVEFLPRLALFWISADSPYGAPEWGFTVDVSDLLRFLIMSLLFGAYFALWFFRRDRLTRQGGETRTTAHGSILGALTSVFGLSTGPCSVVGCGAPVVPVVGLAFAGLSSGALKLLADFSRVATAAVLLTMTVAVVRLGWVVGADPPDRRPA